MYSKITRIVSRISGKAFVGATLNRNEDWITINVNFTRDVFGGAAAIRAWNPLLRPIGKYFVPEIRRIWVHNSKAVEYIGAIIKQRVKEEEADGYEKPNDAIEWVRDYLPTNRKNDIRLAALTSLALGATSVHTTSQMILNVLYDLAARPEYIELLREEVADALKLSNNEWNQDTVNSFIKMDSFIKESQRFSAAVSMLFVQHLFSFLFFFKLIE